MGCLIQIGNPPYLIKDTWSRLLNPCTWSRMLDPGWLTHLIWSRMLNPRCIASFWSRKLHSVYRIMDSKSDWNISRHASDLKDDRQKIESKAWKKVERCYRLILRGETSLQVKNWPDMCWLAGCAFMFRRTTNAYKASSSRCHAHLSIYLFINNKNMYLYPANDLPWKYFLLFVFFFWTLSQFTLLREK